MADQRSRTGPKRMALVWIALLAAFVFVVAGLSLAWLVAESQAQEPGIEVNKTVAGSQTVRVGEVITFHIAIRNSTVFSLTTVPLTDVFRADILSPVPAYANPPYDRLTYVGNSGVISWTDVATHFGGFILPGQTVTVTLAFTAEHPTGQLTVVNRAAVHDAINSLGESVFAGSDDTQNDTIGGSTPLTKTLEPPDYTPEVGLPVTFTIRIKNDGAADLTRLPLEDTYDPAVLAFNYAVPTPTLVITATGVISWADLTAFFGPISGDTSITVTVVFTALRDIETSVNQAQVVGAQDEFGNDLAAGRDEVPIRILPLPLPTATPTATPEEEEEETLPTPTPTPTFTPIPTPTPTSMPAFPTTLPETGAVSGQWPLIIGGLLLALGGSVLRKLWQSPPG
jgi:LPXTG-motif cell wall-anchored protein/uncharacterized repeat protein (TIGR01451 family)